MPSTLHVILWAATAALFWTCLGGALGRRLGFDNGLVWPMAPALGFAVHSAAALPLFFLIGFSAATVFGLAAAVLVASLLALRSGPGAPDRAAAWHVPLWAYLGAALVALAPAAAIMPKFNAAGVVLADPLYDHAKIAIVDEIARLGLPAGNPFFGEPGQPSRLVYYYLWHFAAAELALLPGMSGWAADVALTWVTAFASLAVMLGLATWFAGRRAAAAWVLPLALAASLRPVLSALFGDERVSWALLEATGLAGWLFQAAWVPQHLASATCVVLAVFLLARTLERPSLLQLVTLALVVVAGFETSTWVGGVTFALAAPVVGVVLLVGAQRSQRWPFLLRSAAAAVLALALAAPFLRDQLAVAAARGGTPIGIDPYGVLLLPVSDSVRRLLDLPAYWLVLLVVEFPAIYVTGVVALVQRLARQRKGERRHAALAFAALTAVSLLVVWLLADTLNDNNDLGWRAVLPAVLLLTVFAAAGLAQRVSARAWLPALAAVAAIALGLPDGVRLLHQYTAAPPADADDEFGATPRMWEAVRRHAGPRERVADNPLFLAQTTPWPVNISWALLADRGSCFAGAEYAKVFTALPPARAAEINTLFIRVFAGKGSPDDVRDLALRYGCSAVVVTSDDGAWDNDPFAGSPYYGLAETEAGSWRIYRATEAGAPAANSSAP